MANELIHLSAGTVLTQAEFEAVGLHVCNSQATGDLIYASSATQLTRLAKGAANTVLVMGASIPAWSATLAGLTLTAPVINGIVTTTSTLTLPSVTLGGTITGANQGINQLDYLQGYGVLVLRGAWDAAEDSIKMQSLNAAGNTWLDRLTIGPQTAATATATWIAITQVGLVLGGTMDIGGQALTNVFQLNSITTDVFYQISKNQASDTGIAFYTPGAAAGYADTLRMSIGGRSAAGSGLITLYDPITAPSYEVSGTQVVGARVVDARCDDALNSGDATTDGVIDALRDAMITHGLIAAA